MNKQSACGKAAKRTPGYGAQSMSVPVMKKFIETHGNEKAKNALKGIRGNPSRGDLCSIFHLFAMGRDEIARGEGMRNYKFSPMSNARRSSPVSNARRSSPMKSLSMSSPNLSPNKLLKIVAFMQGRKKRMLKRALRAMPRKLNYLKPKNEYRYGVKVLTGRPNRGNNRLSNGNSNGSRGNGSLNNDNFFGKKNVHFRRGGLNNVRNMVVLKKKKKVKVSRFNVRNNFNAVKPGNKSGRYHPKNNSPTSNERKRMKPYNPNPFINFLEQTKNVRTGMHNRVPTRPHQAPGTMARASNASLSYADRERWNKFKKAVSPRMSPSQRALLANKLLEEVLGRNSPKQRRVTFNSSPKSAPPSPKKKRTKYTTKLSKKLARMAKTKSRRATNALVSKRPTNYGGSSSSSMSNTTSSPNNKKVNNGFIQRLRNARAKALRERQNYLNKKK
jgi:hypothetical protein